MPFFFFPGSVTKALCTYFCICRNKLSNISFKKKALFCLTIVEISVNGCPIIVGHVARQHCLVRVATTEYSSFHSSQEIKGERRRQYPIDLLVLPLKVEPTFTILAFGGCKNVKVTPLQRPQKCHWFVLGERKQEAACHLVCWQCDSSDSKFSLFCP